MTGRSSRSTGAVGIGISSVLMIFVALCLTIFAVLSYLSARADYKLARRSADAISAYYAADSEAEHIYTGYWLRLSQAVSQTPPMRSAHR